MLHYGEGNETEPDPAHMLSKADQEALHPDATTLVLEIHHGYTIRMVRAPSRGSANPRVPIETVPVRIKGCHTDRVHSWCPLQYVP